MSHFLFPHLWEEVVARAESGFFFFSATDSLKTKAAIADNELSRHSKQLA